MIDSAIVCRSQMVPDKGFSISVNEMSFCCNNSYTTRTALQPLPPISTVSDKFGGLVSASTGNGFVFMQGRGLEDIRYYGGNVEEGAGSGREECAFYKHQKELDIEATNDYEMMGPLSPAELVNRGANGNLVQSHGSPFTSFNHAGFVLTVKSERVAALSESYASNLNSYASNLMSVVPLPVNSTSQALMPLKNVSQTLAPAMQQMVNSPQTGAALPEYHQLHLHRSCLIRDDIHQNQSLDPVGPVVCHINTSPILDLPSSSTDLYEYAMPEVDEINTCETAQSICNELKKYSIPQAVFAQRILGRSQGTLSDLLRNPKPWSKLKSGRETFRRMWKWLQESECQRLAQLRLAGGMQSCSIITDAASTLNKQPTTLVFGSHIRCAIVIFVALLYPRCISSLNSPAVTDCFEMVEREREMMPFPTEHVHPVNMPEMDYQVNLTAVGFRLQLSRNQEWSSLRYKDAHWWLSSKK